MQYHKFVGKFCITVRTRSITCLELCSQFPFLISLLSFLPMAPDKSVCSPRTTSGWRLVFMLSFHLAFCHACSTGCGYGDVFKELVLTADKLDKYDDCAVASSYRTFDPHFLERQTLSVKEDQLGYRSVTVRVKGQIRHFRELTTTTYWRKFPNGTEQVLERPSPYVCPPQAKLSFYRDRTTWGKCKLYGSYSPNSGYCPTMTAVIKHYIVRSVSRLEPRGTKLPQQARVAEA